MYNRMPFTAAARRRLRERLAAAARRVGGVVKTVATGAVRKLKASAAASEGHLRAAAPYLKKVGMGLAKAIPGVGKVVKGVVAGKKIAGAIKAGKKAAATVRKVQTKVQKAKNVVYEVNKIVPFKYNMQNRPMRVHTSPRAGSDGSLTINFREYICDVKGISGRDLFRTYHINPSLAFVVGQDITTPPGDISGGTGLFSWLPGVASSFQQYRINKLNCEFVTTSGNVTTSQALGTILMGIQYDSAEKPFLTQASILNSEGGKSCVPARNMSMHYESDKANTAIANLYTVDSTKVPAYPIPPNKVSTVGTFDPRLFYAGILTVATVGCPTGTVAAPTTLGQLWVNYSMTLIRPRVP